MRREHSAKDGVVGLGRPHGKLKPPMECPFVLIGALKPY